MAPRKAHDARSGPDEVLGTGSLALVSAPSQPHRAELTKVMTTASARGRVRPTGVDVWTPTGPGAVSPRARAETSFSICAGASVGPDAVWSHASGRYEARSPNPGDAPPTKHGWHRSKLDRRARRVCVLKRADASGSNTVRGAGRAPRGDQRASICRSMPGRNTLRAVSALRPRSCCVLSP
ncbi:hypothetical protein CNR27_07745 [Luteimonas chenhongjianii]|uniref:Uncharacterized protein n=1 Tax=Luteimonas chenhongjianii TaxID=2006110 RepID=A0A290XE24_9GAMM|nr:hypothetical protein CNR27_07745 [Luteimonas chenhongjianii]